MPAPSARLPLSPPGRGQQPLTARCSILAFAPGGPRRAGQQPLDCNLRLPPAACRQKRIRCRDRPRTRCARVTPTESPRASAAASAGTSAATPAPPGVHDALVVPFCCRLSACCVRRDRITLIPSAALCAALQRARRRHCANLSLAASFLPSVRLNEPCLAGRYARFCAAMMSCRRSLFCPP